MEKYLLLIQFLNQTHTLIHQQLSSSPLLHLFFQKMVIFLLLGSVFSILQYSFFDCAITNFWGAAEIFRMMQ